MAESGFEYGLEEMFHFNHGHGKDAVGNMMTGTVVSRVLRGHFFVIGLH